MQLHLAFLEPDPPSPTTSANPPCEQIDESVRTVALEVLARLIASMLGASEKEMPDE